MADVMVIAPKKLLLVEDNSEIRVVPDGVRRVWDRDQPQKCRCGHYGNVHYPKSGDGYFRPCWHRFMVGAYDTKRCYCRNWHPRGED